MFVNKMVFIICIMFLAIVVVDVVVMTNYHGNYHGMVVVVVALV